MRSSAARAALDLIATTPSRQAPANPTPFAKAGKSKTQNPDYAWGSPVAAATRHPHALSITSSAHNGSTDEVLTQSGARGFGSC